MGALSMFMEWVKPQPRLSDEDKKVAKWAEAVKNSNWVLLHQMRFEQQLDADDFFDAVAMGYCYCYAAGVEPTRDADWTAFKKTLENLHYPAMAEAIVLRNDGR